MTVPVTVHAFSGLVTISLIKGVNSNNFSYKLIKGINLAHESLCLYGVLNSNQYLPLGRI